jgi:phage-related protein
MIGRDGIARSIFVAAHGRRVVVLYTFLKKTQKTPPSALEIVRQRSREIT